MLALAWRSAVSGCWPRGSVAATVAGCEGALVAGIAGVAEAPELIYAELALVRGLSHAAAARAAAATAATSRVWFMAASGYFGVVVVVEVTLASPRLPGAFTSTEVVEVELGVVLSAGGLMFVVELVATGGGVVVLG